MSAPHQHGDLVTVAGLPLEFVYQDDAWAEVIPPASSTVGFTVHESEIGR